MKFNRIKLLTVPIIATWAQLGVRLLGMANLQQTDACSALFTEVVGRMRISDVTCPKADA